MKEIYDLTYNYHGKQYCEPGYCWGPGVKDHYKILFIHEGKGTYHINGSTYELEQGQGFMVFPDTLCQMKADEREPWVYSWIAFHGSCVDRLLEQVRLSRKNPAFRFGPADWFDSWLNQFAEADQLACNSGLAIHGILYRLFAEWISLLSAPLQAGQLSKPKEAYVRKAIEYMTSNYYAKISISELAKMIGIDRIYLSTLFKQFVKQSPQAYLLNYRMNKACDLMNNPMLSVSEISHSVGYTDPLLFSKMFKKVKGISPSQYRREHDLTG